MTRRTLYTILASITLCGALAEAAQTVWAWHRHLPTLLWLTPASACLWLVSSILFAIQARRPASNLPWNYTGDRKPITSNTYRRAAIVCVCLVAFSMLMAIYARHTYAESQQLASDCSEYTLPVFSRYLPWGFAVVIVLGVFGAAKNILLSRKLGREELLSGTQKA